MVLEGSYFKQIRSHETPEVAYPSRQVRQVAPHGPGVSGKVLQVSQRDVPVIATLSQGEQTVWVLSNPNPNMQSPQSKGFAFES